jgi:DNA-binding ferritin-like protein
MNAILADVYALYLKTKNFHWEDNRTLGARLREAHGLCEEHRDVATASVIEVWIDETERRSWFLFESVQRGIRVAIEGMRHRCQPLRACAAAAAAAPLLR